MAFDHAATDPDAWTWAEPLVVDALHGVYEALLDDDAAASEVAREHARLWHRLFNRAPDLDGLLELEIKLGILGLGIDAIHSANAAVARELADVASLRFRRSPRQESGLTSAITGFRDRMTAIVAGRR
jgi:hypothetical protein